MEKWISVQDRFPEVHEEVLVFAVDKDNPNGEPVYALTAMREYRTLNGPVKSWIQPWQYFNANYRVTHWMPLPEPPKEE